MGGMRRTIECISITEDDRHAYCGTRTGDVLKFKIDRDDIRVGYNTNTCTCTKFTCSFSLPMWLILGASSCRPTYTTHAMCQDLQRLQSLVCVPKTTARQTLQFLSTDRRPFLPPRRRLTYPIIRRWRSLHPSLQPTPFPAASTHWAPVVVVVVHSILAGYLSYIRSVDMIRCTDFAVPYRVVPCRALHVHTALRLRQYFNDPDTIRPTLTGYSLEKFGKGVRSVCCVLNPETGNTNTLVGGGDGTVSFVNQSLNKVCFFHGGRAGEWEGGRVGGWEGHG